MYEQEKQRTTHLLILLVFTFLTIALTGESLLLGWDMGAVVLLLLGLVASWTIHISGRIPASIRLWLYYIMTMLAFFFYGIHETSMYDLAPVMIVVLIMYSATEMKNIINLCVAVYYLTMCYDLIFVLGGSLQLTPLSVTRTLLHMVLVYLAGWLVKLVIQWHKKERKTTDGKIAELEEDNRRTEDFLTNVSHELRTPINVVTGITSVMLKNEENEEKKKDIFSIQKAGRRLFDQIEDILDYTEIDTGKIAVSKDSYMISSLINDIVAWSRMSERENKPELIFDIDTSVPSALLGDEKKIKKILKHLIDNAMKFTQSGGICVRIYALPKPYGVNLCIRVSDTGVGIAEEELGKIKERFYQSNGGRNRKAGGLGLGLSIVYGMVSVMEGFMQIESTLGEGTTVSVSIPQEISDERTCMAVERREDLCLASFLELERYDTPQVRNFYNQFISHMVHNLDIPLHRVSDREELDKLTRTWRLTHLFVGEEQYEENVSYFETLSPDIKVIVIAEEHFVLPQGSRAKVLQKPLVSLQIAGLLNVRTEEEEDLLAKKRAVYPGVSVLVVDDEPMNLMVAEGIFRDYQMKVTTAESGLMAMEHCEREDFDLVFLDHMMPEMDGVETLKQLRKIDKVRGKVLTVIAFTANAVSGAREMFLREGFDEFISKPIEPLELERVLRKVLPKSSIVYVDENEVPGKGDVAAQGSTPAVPALPAQEPEAQTPEEEKIRRLSHIGIQTQSGIRYCRNDKVFYLELLNGFAKDAGKKEKEINQFFEQNDFKNYAIFVHALKSSAELIGAKSLSEMAKKSEEAAKKQDALYIKEHHRQLLDVYHELAGSIAKVLASGENCAAQTEEEEKTQLSKDQLIRRLEELKEKLDSFESDRAHSVIVEIEKTVCPGVSMDAFLSDVKEDVENFEYEAALEKTEKFITKVKGGEAE